MNKVDSPGLENVHVEVPEYIGNPLIEACGPILSEEEITRKMLFLPEPPKNINVTPPHIRSEQLMIVDDLYIPNYEAIKLGMNIAKHLRRSYVGRNPSNPEVMANLYGTKIYNTTNSHSPLNTIVVGKSGTGKSASCQHALSIYPQVLEHSNFPNMASKVRQLVWLKVDVPASGRLLDLSRALMSATEAALKEQRFKYKTGNSQKASDNWLNWLQVAKTHFLGILVLDEVQNLFKLTPRAKRLKSNKQHNAFELRLSDDEALKTILTLSNSSQMAVVLVGTEDGVAALDKRFSIVQRTAHGGLFRFDPTPTADDQFYKDYQFPKLLNYLWADEKLKSPDEIRVLLHELSAGIPRIRASLWIHAHECMWERHGRSLEKQDFVKALQTRLSQLIPAIDALRSGDPLKMGLYEDMLPNNFINLA